MKFNKDQVSFLKEFNFDENIDFIIDTYVKTPKIESLYNIVKPEPNKKKVVLIDGHPRTGKTWLAQALVCKRIDELKTNKTIWHSGIDSIKIFKNLGTDETIFNGFKKLQEEFSTNSDIQKKDFFLIDDFFGTNRLRPFGTDICEKEKIEPFLKLNDNPNNHPIIKLLPKSCTLIFTSRSLFVYLLYTTYSVKLPLNRISFNSGEFIPIKWGVFQTLDKEKIAGSFNIHAIDTIYNKISSFQLNSDFNFITLVKHSPIISFSTIYNNDDESLEEEVGELLFGEDIDTLKRMIIEVQSLTSSRNEYSNLYYKLIRLYFLIISPNLFFNNRKLFLTFTNGEETDSLSHALYYSEEELKSTRIPSIYYFKAVNRHLENNLEFALQILEELSKQNKIEAIHILFRGFAEKALSNSSTWELHSQLVKHIRGSSELTNLFNKALNDKILQIEFHADETKDIKINFPRKPNPIFFSYSSWCINELLRNDVHYEYIQKIYRSKYLSYFIKEVNKAGKNTVISDKLLAGFSTFLQWNLKNRQLKPNVIEKMGYKIYSKISRSSLMDRITTILEDELIWALFEKINTSDQRIPPTELLKINFIRSTFLQSFENVNFREIRYIDLNRYFSLIWHNEWMMPSEEKVTIDYYPIINKWCNNYHGFLTISNVNIEDVIGYLIKNFIYHWYHFITQRAIWLRDWCLSKDPLEAERNYETTQITMGSKNPIDHKKLFELFCQLSANISDKSPHMKSLFKTTFFFISLRTAVIENSEEGKTLSNYYRNILYQRINNKEIHESLLIASFELSRHGFLQPWSEIISEEHKIFIMEIINKNSDLLAQAWKKYYSELEICLNEYDFIPQKDNGWLSIFPQEYYKNIKHETNS